MIRHPDNNYIGYIGGDTGILVFQILLKKGITKHQFLKNAQECQLGTLQILILYDIKSIKNHSGTFNVWLPQSSTRLECCIVISSQSLAVAGYHGKRHAMPMQKPQALSDWLNTHSLGTISAFGSIANLA